jgi:hypothetical protein
MCRKNDNTNFGARQDGALRRSNVRNKPSRGSKRRTKVDGDMAKRTPKKVCAEWGDDTQTNAMELHGFQDDLHITSWSAAARVPGSKPR